MNNLDTFAQEHKAYTKLRSDHWDNIAERKAGVLTRHYRTRLTEIYRHVVGECSSILEIGCGSGDLLNALNPAKGVGIDISPKMIARAQQQYPDLQFVCADAQAFDLGETVFDVIILSDVLNDLWDVQAVLTHLQRYCDKSTRIIFNVFSHAWEYPRHFFEMLGLVTPNLSQNWLTPIDVHNLADLAGYEQVKHWEEVLCPLPIPVVASFCNRILVKMPLFRAAALTNFYVFRPHSKSDKRDAVPSVSVIVAARNESGHIDELMQRIPDMGSHTEIVFVEGNSTDDTYQVIEEAISKSARDCKLLKQPGKGKGDAVRAGFAIAKGDILMILDADITVPPEDLQRFVDVLASGAGEFANGVRLVYPMQDDAMRFLNLLGNKFFSWAFSWLLGQPIRDTLCGTKVLWATDYQKIANGRSYFGEFDPFGDFDLLFGAARQNLKILEVPIRYRARRYGETNISRWSHGWLLLQMVVFAARRIKFI